MKFFNSKRKIYYQLLVQIYKIISNQNQKCKIIKKLNFWTKRLHVKHSTFRLLLHCGYILVQPNTAKTCLPVFLITYKIWCYEWDFSKLPHSLDFFVWVLAVHLLIVEKMLVIFQWLRRNKLALSENDFKSTYLAELLASIAYTRGRLMFYKEFEGDREEHIDYLKLAYYITKEVRETLCLF